MGTKQAGTGGVREAKHPTLLQEDSRDISKA